MPNHHLADTDSTAIKPLVLISVEIDKLLSMRLIANLATLDKAAAFISCLCGSFESITIFISLLLATHKYRNLVSRPRASVMIDISKAGLNLKGVLIKCQVELVVGEEAQKINRLIHLKDVTQDALDDTTVASYLSKGDDVTVKVHIDRLISWNLDDSCWDGSSQRWLVPPLEG
ncbi:MAG: hypothetical protein WBQ25_05235 [Nitrososphaeraceae archaeon]